MGEILQYDEGYEPSFLNNYKNYWIYADMVRNRTGMKVYVPEDISANNIADHIDAINAILKDGIDTDYVHALKITVDWGGDAWCNLFIVDYWYNLFMWSMILKTGGQISPRNIFCFAIAENRYFLSIDHKTIFINVQFSRESSECRVILQHVLHVLQICVPLVDRYDVNIRIIYRCTDNDSADSSETTDSNWRCDDNRKNHRYVYSIWM